MRVDLTSGNENDSKEVWKKVSGYDGRYEVSSIGRIRSFIGWKSRWSEIPRILSPSKTAVGYLQIFLWKRGEYKVMSIHRLVAAAFVENPHGYRYVNHKDGDKLNNSADNLEWCTQSYNIKHAYDLGLRTFTERTLESNKRRGKSVLQILDGKVIAKYPSAAEASRATGIQKANIGKCCRGGNIKHAGGYEWRFSDES